VCRADGRAWEPAERCDLNAGQAHAGQQCADDVFAQAGIKDTAKQLEGLFMQELVKSMRSTTMNSGMKASAKARPCATA